TRSVKWRWLRGRPVVVWERMYESWRMMLMSRSLNLLVAALMLAAGLISASGLLAQTPWAAPDTEKAKKNPLPSDKKTIEQGGKSAKVKCQTCQGVNGKGDGAGAVALNPKPADWTSGAVQSETDGELFWKISNGRGPMPPWKHLSENDRWAL